MHWKHIWTGLMAATATIRAFSSQQLAVEKKLEQPYVKWLSEPRNDEEGRAAPEIFTYIFAAIFTSVFVCAVTRHFISCQRKQNNSMPGKGQQRMAQRRASLIATLPFAAVLLSKVTALAAQVSATRKVNGEAVIAATKKLTASTLTVKRTSKGRKSFHNCVRKNLKLLCVRLVGLAQMPLTLFRRRATAMANPLQKLPLMELQQAHQQQKSEATLRNEAHFQSNSNQQLSLTVAGWSPSPRLPTTLNALTFDAAGVSVSTHGAVSDCKTTSIYCSSSRGGGSNNQAIAIFTKDPSKDQILLMMIAQRFDCQHVYKFVIVTPDVSQVQQQEQWKQRQQKMQRMAITAKVLEVNWQSNCIAPPTLYCEC